MNLMTHLFPYNDESLLLTCDTIYMLIDEKLQFMCQNIKLKRHPRPQEEGHFLKIPKGEAVISLQWKCKGDPVEHYTGFLDKRNDKVTRNSYEKCYIIGGSKRGIH